MPGSDNAPTTNLTALELSGVRRLSALEPYAPGSLSPSTWACSPPASACPAPYRSPGPSTSARSPLAAPWSHCAATAYWNAAADATAAPSSPPTPPRARSSTTETYRTATDAVHRLIDHRLALECGIAHLASVRASRRRPVASSRTSSSEMDRAPSWAEFHGCDERFHLRLAAATGVPVGRRPLRRGPARALPLLPSLPAGRAARFQPRAPRPPRRAAPSGHRRGERGRPAPCGNTAPHHVRGPAERTRRHRNRRPGKLSLPAGGPRPARRRDRGVSDVRGIRPRLSRSLGRRVRGRGDAGYSPDLFSARVPGRELVCWYRGRHRAVVPVPGEIPMSTYRVAQVAAPNGPFEIVEREVPRPGPGQVRIAVEACGVCHS